MAFLQVATGGGGDFTPILAYNATQGRIYLRDRVQNGAGDWEAKETDVTKAEPAFAVDFGQLEVGWTHFVRGMAPQWMMVPYGHAIPPRPVSPGNDDKGKALNYKSGFRIKVAGNAIGGVRELAGNSAALVNGMNELHTQFEASPEAAAGKIPVVKIANTISVKAGQSTNFQPVFSIIAWVDRPEVLGPRTVPAPTMKNGHAGYTPTQTPIAEMKPEQVAHVAAATVTKPVVDSMPF